MAELVAPMFRPLSVHDAALVNAIGAAVVTPCIEADELVEALGIARDVLPLCSRDHVLMRDLVVAAEAMLAALPHRLERPAPGEINRWARADFDARLALGRVMRVRASQAFIKAIEGVAR